MPPLLKGLQWVALAEGLSFLLLLFVAMPLKYLADREILVRILGPIHGGLFLLYLLVVVLAIPALLKLGWSWLKILAAVVASVLPFGTFVVEAQLRREYRR